MSLDPLVRFMKSSGYKNPVPISLISNIFYLNKNIENKIVFNLDSNHKKL